MGESHVLQPVRLEERLLPVEARSDTFDTATSLVAAIELPPPSSHARGEIVASARAPFAIVFIVRLPRTFHMCGTFLSSFSVACVDHLSGSIKAIVFFMSSTVA